VPPAVEGDVEEAGSRKETLGLFGVKRPDFEGVFVGDLAGEEPPLSR
jgi:hypothetical protein